MSIRVSMVRVMFRTESAKQRLENNKEAYKCKIQTYSLRFSWPVTGAFCFQRFHFPQRYVECLSVAGEREQFDKFLRKKLCK